MKTWYLKTHVPKVAYITCKDCRLATDITDFADFVWQPTPDDPRKVIACRLKGFVFYADTFRRDTCPWIPKNPKEWAYLAYLRRDLDLPRAPLDAELRQSLLIVGRRYEEHFRNLALER